MLLQKARKVESDNPQAPLAQGATKRVGWTPRNVKFFFPKVLRPPSCQVLRWRQVALIGAVLGRWVGPAGNLGQHFGRCKDKIQRVVKVSQSDGQHPAEDPGTFMKDVVGSSFCTGRFVTPDRWYTIVDIENLKIVVLIWKLCLNCVDGVLLLQSCLIKASRLLLPLKRVLQVLYGTVCCLWLCIEL